MFKLLPHQERLVKENPNKALLNWEMRTGKTLPASIWIDLPEQAGNTYIITPKQNKKDWLDLKTKATVLSKEEFKKIVHTIVSPTAMVVDEIHYFASALFLGKGKKRSALADSLYNLVRNYPNCHFLGLSATMVRQDAWSLHTILCYAGIYYDWKKWRNEFFELKYPHDFGYRYLQRPAYFPRADWRIKIRYYLEKHTDIVSLKDIVEYLPEATSTVIKIKQPKYERPEDKVVTWVDEHLHEQQGKVKEILALGYRKLLVVAHYTAQIDSLAEELSKEKPVYILDGRTKDASKTKLEAQEAEECYFIVQASMGFAFDGYMFGAIVFASMSHSCLSHTQMTGRLRHLKHLQPVFYYYLIGGRWDARVKETIDLGRDFNPHQYRDSVV
jgi:superfamily II DNA or RNA helicase